MSHFTAARGFYLACFATLQRVLHQCLMVFFFFRHLPLLSSHCSPFTLCPKAFTSSQTTSQWQRFAAVFFIFRFFFFLSNHKSLMYKVITVLSAPNTPAPDSFPSIFRASLSAERLVILAPLYLASARLSLQHGGRDEQRLGGGCLSLR